MKAKDIFGIFVRVIGLCLFLFSMWHLVMASVFLADFGVFQIQYPSVLSSYSSALVSGPTVVIAVIFLRFARQIVRFTYPHGKDDSDA